MEKYFTRRFSRLGSAEIAKHRKRGKTVNVLKRRRRKGREGILLLAGKRHDIYQAPQSARWERRKKSISGTVPGKGK